MAGERIATIRRHGGENYHLLWDVDGGEFRVEELDRTVAHSVVAEMDAQGLLDVTNHAAYGLATSTLDREADAGEEEAEERHRAVWVRVLATGVAALLVGLLIGGGARLMLDPPRPPAPVVTPEPAPTEPDEASAAAAVSGYYALVSAGDYAGALTAMDQRYAAGIDETAAVAANRDASYTVEVSALDALVRRSPIVSQTPTLTAYDLAPALLGSVRTSVAGLPLGEGPAPALTLYWDRKDDSVTLVDRNFIVAAAKPPANEYAKKTGNTSVTLGIGTIFRSPWISLARLSYRDNGSSGNVPVVLAAESTSTAMPDGGTATVYWKADSLSWTLPRRMSGFLTVTTTLQEDSMSSELPPLSQAPLPLAADRQGYNVMPLVRLAK